MHVISNEGESVRPNENLKSSEFTYHNKDTNPDVSAYNMLLNALTKLDTEYNPTIPRMNKPLI